MTREEVTARWSKISKNLPLVCGLKTFGGELTVYASLLQAARQFDHVVVTDDGSKDNTLEEVTACIKDNNLANVTVYNVGDFNPWVDNAGLKREGDHHITRENGKTHAKSQWKSYEIVKKTFPGCIFISLEDDVIIENNVRTRVIERISKWQDPYTDCEFFNVSSIIDDDHVLLGCKLDGSKLDGIVQRRLYNNGGDWTLAAIWTGGELQIGPDPLYPFGACIFPWLPKNQLGKKGQDGERSFGFHMINYRTTKNLFEYDANVRGVCKIGDLVDKEHDVDWDLIKRIRIRQRFKLERVGDKYVQVLS